ncbi:MAG: D-alanyl-D-alanine carboxypeptidase [Candidatus Berkelbacteria bacterium Licking1014_7]|uniref:D-alanyl-D-alanine carboxypeptidase n=1 Tax=Candidatus Berkelbacteria bacterium Licking1014_7 TaxID=2017147 RepID=A0A554LI10_9BACT|nr:MAG: D-alanyl-D-alanine carboxypeptidase [Candidatus Berkelbacteria bacterium Licking1014_7]
MKYLRIALGIFLVLSIFATHKIFNYWEIRLKKQIKGVESANLNLPNYQINPVPIKKNDAIAPENFWQGVLIDQNSQKILFGKNEHKPVSVASITKLATALTALDNYQLDEIVEISTNASNINGSKIFMSTGEKFTVENLLNALLIMSANDAAIALSEHKQTQEKFIEMMNEKSRKIGMKNTRFLDPSGLNDEGYSTARDIGILFSEALKNDIITKIIGMAEKTIYNQSGTKSYKLESSNRLVKDEMRFEGIVGGKTGFTPNAGHSLVAAATRDNHTLIAVILSTYSNTKEASAIAAADLLNWGFTNWQWENI